ncbi:MAG: hypothetical protein M3513_12855 [Actinomycetota bacterium]|nr:hypothetical protein [Actinomycetota bacterium]
MDLSKLSDRERLVVEQAVTTYRALERAALDAPYGKGLATLEEVIHDKGFEHLRNMLTVAASARPEAQKRGSVSGPVIAATRASSSG